MTAVLPDRLLPPSFLTGFPDIAGDAAAGKLTLTVRLGGSRTARLHNVMLLATYGLLPVLVLAGLPLWWLWHFLFPISG